MRRFRLRHEVCVRLYFALCLTLAVLGARSTRAEPAFLRGDANQDRRVDISDPIRSLDVLFRGTLATCFDAMDANDDGKTDISDPIWTIQYLFSSGSPPPSPFPECGVDPTPDAIGCALSTACPASIIQVWGRVADLDGDGIAGATIRLRGAPETVELVSNDDGRFVASLETGDATALQVEVRASGFASGQKEVLLSPGLTRFQVAVNLIAIGTIAVDENPADGVEVVVEGIGGAPGRLTIPAGAIASTTPIEIEMTTLDPNAHAIAAPGDFRARVEPSPENGDSTEALLESLGMVEVKITDLETGAAIPALLTPAILEQRLPTALIGRYSAGDEVQLWFFDEVQGLWVEDGVGQVYAHELGDLWLRAEILHFTWWNWDRIPDRACVKLRFDVPRSVYSDFVLGVQGVTYAGHYPGALLEDPLLGFELAVVRSTATDIALSRLLAVIEGEYWYLEETAPGIVRPTKSETDAWEITSPSDANCLDLGTVHLDHTFTPRAVLQGSRSPCLGSVAAVDLMLETLYLGPTPNVTWTAPAGGTILTSSASGASFLPPDAVGSYIVEATAVGDELQTVTTSITVSVVDCARAVLSSTNRRRCLGVVTAVEIALLTEHFDPSLVVEWSAPDGGTILASSETDATFLPPDVVGNYPVVVKVSDARLRAIETRIVVFVSDCSGLIEEDFSRGDVNGDGVINITDVVSILGAIGATNVPSPFESCDDVVIDPTSVDFTLIPCLDAADANDDGELTCADALAINDFLFGGGAAFPPPFGGIGVDPTPDPLSCETGPDPLAP
jgi:hypothetical protein